MLPTLKPVLLTIWLEVTDDWTTVDIPPHLELYEGNAGIEVIPNDSKDIKEDTSMISGENCFCYLNK
jgi:hypothetical protein